MRTARLTTVAAAVAALVLAAPAPAAAARQTLKKTIWGPVQVNGVSQFPIYRELGAGIYHTTLDWAEVAPERPARPRDHRDPAYRWPEELTTAVREARRHRMRVAITVWHSPAWANGGRSVEWAPRRAKDYADFIEAAARRYRGARYWLIWGEPSRQENFKPVPRNSSKGPRIYARLLDAAYARLKRVSRRNIVVGGNTFTTGTVAPRLWVRHLKLRNGRRPRMDLYGHNPFSRRRPRLSDPPLAFGYVDFSSLDDFARELDRAYRRKKLNFFLSEFTIPTGQPNYAFNFHETEEVAASWLRSALRITRRWRRIHTLGWFTLYDHPPSPTGDEPLLGLMTHDGSRRKPAFDAYRKG